MKSYTPDFVELINAELDRLSELPPNWDGQGAQRIKPAIIEDARSFIASLPSNLIPPKVVPMAKGNLQFEWHDDSRSLELEIEQPQVIHYLKWHPEEGIDEEESFPLLHVGRAVDLICWFMKGTANV